MPLPRMCPAVRDRLKRQPPRRDAVEAGYPLYVLRLGITVLPHLPVDGAWLCTVIACDRPGMLPTGICTVHDLDLATAVEVRNPWCPHVDLTAADYLSVWEVRARQRFCGRPGTLEAALVAAADTDTLQVATGRQVNPRLATAAGCGRYPAAVRVECARLVAAGFLLTLFTDDTDPERRYAFAIPPAPWPTP